MPKKKPAKRAQGASEKWPLVRSTSMTTDFKQWWQAAQSKEAPVFLVKYSQGEVADAASICPATG